MPANHLQRINFQALMKAWVVFAMSCLLAGTALDADQPNVLFIAVDDLNTSPHIFEGETSVPTLNLERLANKGMLFGNAHCAAPACNPSRVSVISGLAPSTTGVYLNRQDWRDNNLLKDWVTIPHYFQANGYKTMGGGKIYHASSLSKGAYTGFLPSVIADANARCLKRMSTLVPPRPSQKCCYKVMTGGFICFRPYQALSSLVLSKGYVLAVVLK